MILSPLPFLPDRIDPTDLIWRKLTLFEAMTGHTAPLSDGLLAELSGVFLSCKANTRRSVHSPQDHFIITLIISDRHDWRDTWGKWSLWHRHNSLKLFWLQPMAPWTAGHMISISEWLIFYHKLNIIVKIKKTGQM